jgi:hypothetical protein
MGSSPLTAGAQPPADPPGVDSRSPISEFIYPLAKPRAAQ